MASEISFETSFDQVCRACLQSGSVLLCLFEESQKKSGAESCSIADMIKDITSLKIKKKDGLPEKICLPCVGEVNRAYSFRVKCENSDATLRRYLSKKEIIEDDEKSNDNFTDCKSNSQVDKLKEEEEEVHNNESENEDDFSSTVIIVENHKLLNFLEDNSIGSEDFRLENIEVEDEDDDEENMGSTIQKILLSCSHCNNYFENEEIATHEDRCSQNPSNKILADKRGGKKVKKKSIKCLYCPVDFVHAKNLEKHVKKHHRDPLDEPKDLDDKDEEHQDKESNPDLEDSNEKSMNAIEILDDALDEVALKKAEIKDFPESCYKCPHCKAGFAQEKSLNFHLKQNKCTEEQFECLICKKVFINKQKLLNHMKSHSKFQCFRCLRTFSSQDILSLHMEEEHRGKMKNQCNTCGKVFSMLSSLKDHLRTHSGEKPFLCSICGKGFTQNTNLKQHMMRHQQMKPFRCKDCSSSFVSKGELNAHMRTHTGEHPFICSVCNAAFTTSSSLVKHHRIHTGERPYACEFCPMRFTALGTLKNHRRTHTGEKPFKCKQCGRAFAQKSDCISHMRTHTGEKPHICPVCGLTFIQSGTMKAHLKLHKNTSKNHHQEKFIDELEEDSESRRDSKDEDMEATLLKSDSDSMEEDDNRLDQQQPFVKDSRQSLSGLSHAVSSETEKGNS